MIEKISSWPAFAFLCRCPRRDSINAQKFAIWGQGAFSSHVRQSRLSFRASHTACPSTLSSALVAAGGYPFSYSKGRRRRLAWVSRWFTYTRCWKLFLYLARMRKCFYEVGRCFILRQYLYTNRQSTLDLRSRSLHHSAGQNWSYYSTYLD